MTVLRTRFPAIFFLLVSILTWPFQSAGTTGDLNGDASIGLTDVVVGLQVLTGSATGNNVSLAADVNNDARVGAAETIFALRSVAAGVRHPFPAHQTYAPGTIHPSGFAQGEQDDHVRALYDHWKASYLAAAGSDSSGRPLYRVATGVGSDTTVSEGQGYGMIITAHMAGHDPDARTLFDGLWRFVRRHPSGIDNRLMTWKVRNGVAVDGNDSAFDGDADIALGLILADAQWGSHTGAIDYLAEARTVIQGIMQSTIGPVSHLPLLGDWVDPDGSPYNQYTFRSSDFLPAHFRLFARVSGDPAWNQVLAATREAVVAIQDNYSPLTGLLPDFVVQCVQATSCIPASPYFLEGPHDGHYYYNAGRDPWRIGMDALVNDDQESRTTVQRMIAWLVAESGGDANGIKAGYKLDGTIIGNYFTTFFTAPFGVAAMTGPYQELLDSIYTRVHASPEGYYEDSVNLLALLLLTGNFWLP